MTKPWTMETFPKDRPVYIRRRGSPLGASLITTIHPMGVNVLVCDDKGKTSSMGVSWRELAAVCETWDKKPCGE